MLSCTDSDAAIRALCWTRSARAVSDIEIRSAGLEEAFLELTGGEYDRQDDEGLAACKSA